MDSVNPIPKIQPKPGQSRKPNQTSRIISELTKDNTSIWLTGQIHPDTIHLTRDNSQNCKIHITYNSNTNDYGWYCASGRLLPCITGQITLQDLIKNMEAYDSVILTNHPP